MKKECRCKTVIANIQKKKNQVNPRVRKKKPSTCTLYSTWWLRCLGADNSL